MTQRAPAIKSRFYEHETYNEMKLLPPNDTNTDARRSTEEAPISLGSPSPRDFMLPQTIYQYDSPKGPEKTPLPTTAALSTDQPFQFTVHPLVQTSRFIDTPNENGKIASDREAMQAMQNRILNHPSREFIIPRESVPYNKTDTFRYNSGLVGHYHHSKGTGAAPTRQVLETRRRLSICETLADRDEMESPSDSQAETITSSEYVTQIEIGDVFSERRLLSLTYYWNGIPSWVYETDRESFDMTISQCLVAWVSSEGLIGYSLRPLQSSDLGVATSDNQRHHLVPIGPILNFHEKQMRLDPDQVPPYDTKLEITQTTIASHRYHVAVLVVMSDNMAILIVVNVANDSAKYICHYNVTNDVQLPKTRSRSKFLFLLKDYFVFVAGFGNASSCKAMDENESWPHFKIICVSRWRQEVVPEMISVSEKRSTFSRSLSRNLSLSRLSHGLRCIGGEITKDGNTCELHVVEEDPRATTVSSLNNLARAFTAPFFSLILSELTDFSNLFARLNSPWAFPVAGIQIILFFIFFPLLLIPNRHKTLVVDLESRDTVKSRIKTAWRYSRYQESFVPLREELRSPFFDVKKTDTYVRIRKFIPDADSRREYNQARVFRMVSVVFYLSTLGIFCYSFTQVVGYPQGDAFDLLAHIGLCDAMSIFAISLSQDMAVFVPIIKFWILRGVSGKARSTRVPGP
ncbi:hypothetical protein CJU89_5535 [Yarrowia sp. B02]|nr:hypothetical protein CJU89_5535 [Yarrowia sp. B02]